MRFVLTSENQAKVTATRTILEKFYPGYKLDTISVDSGVSETPDSDEEGIQGCLNRIAAAYGKVSDANGYIGLEGIVTQNRYGRFLCGWCVVELDGQTGMGCSAKVRLPDYISSKLTSDRKLSAVMMQQYKSKLLHDMPQIGTNGIITNRAYTREDEFIDAMNCAFGYLANPTNQVS